MRVGIIGGGAAGFFAAINIAEKRPDARVTILEKSSKVLQKVKVSGGGRCNVTNGRVRPADLVPFYPRGGKKLYKSFQQFGTEEMRRWLGERGVMTKVESDLRAFPISDNSQTIIDCFLQQCQQLNIDIRKQQSVTGISFEEQWLVHTSTEKVPFDRLIVATGSSEKSWSWLEQLGLTLISRVPSLFTFNIKDPRIEALQGLAFEYSRIKIAGTKLNESGPLLVTHWGVSGPAVLKLSSVAARELAEKNYSFDIILSLTGQTALEFQSWLMGMISSNPKKQIGNIKIPGCPQRYWTNLLKTMNIADSMQLLDLSKKSINRLTEEMTQARFVVDGKSTFKEEFVTSGGVALGEVDLHTMQCKNHEGLYLAGEVLDIDALTGGFNFQSCWTGGWLISEHMKNS